MKNGVVAFSFSALSILSFISLDFLLISGKRISTTLDGPFKPVTVPFDTSLRGHAVDLPDSDPRVQRRVDAFEPEQISVSLSSNYDSVWISWITGEYQIGYDIKPLDPNSVKSVVHYGTTKYQLIHMATGYSLVYNQLYPFVGLQNYTSGIIHHARLTGLKPSTLYYYRCGDPSISAMSKIYSFKTMPVSGPGEYPQSIAVVGDLGLTYNTTATISHLISNKPDLVLLVGDVTYANLYLTNGTGSDCYSCTFPNSPIHETYQPRWDYWGRYMQNLVSKVPIMVVEGNHEIEQQAENQTFVAYSSRFAFPAEESRSSSTFYYSFNAGGIHFVMLGAYIAYDKSADQYKWLERDLDNVDRAVTPWLVAAWHPPWYSTYQAHYREAECMKVAMEELLYSYGVDIVFNGHVHAYERSNRVYDYNLDDCGPVHITVGDGGNREKMAIRHADEQGFCPEPSSTPDKHMGGFCAENFTSGPAAGKFCWDRQPDYSAFRESSFGHGILEVKNETWALWTWYRNQDSHKVAADEIYIVRQPDICRIRSKADGRWWSAAVYVSLWSSCFFGMASGGPNLECRMYETKYPEVDMAVMIQVKSIADMGAYVSLLEYNNIEGMILFSELSRRRIRSVNSLIKIGRIEPVMVLRVDKEKGYIDLSKRRVSEEDIKTCEERFNKSKLVHSIMRHVAETLSIDLEDLYVRIGWPLYHKYGHAFEAFKIIVTDPDSVLDSLTYEVKEVGTDGQEVSKVVPAVTSEIKDSLVKNIRRRMTPQPMKIRADIEMNCFQFDGVLHIKDVMRQAEAAGDDDCPVKIKLVAPPLYVLTTQTLDKEKGISILENAIEASTREIENHNGRLVVKEPPRAVSERDDKLLAEHMAKLSERNQEISGDEESEEEEDTGMGDIDLENAVGISE